MQMAYLDERYDQFGGGGGFRPPPVTALPVGNPTPMQPPITTPNTPSVPVVRQPAPTIATTQQATGDVSSLYKFFTNLTNSGQPGNPALPGMPAYQGGGGVPGMPAIGGGGGGYNPNFLGTKEDLLNPVAGTDQVSRSLQAFLDPNSAYMRNAAQRGVEMAAARGGVNSSIASGSAQRAALEAVQPFVAQAVDVDQQKYKLLGQDYLAEKGYSANSQLQNQLADKNSSLQSALAQYRGGLEMSMADKNNAFQQTRDQYQGELQMSLNQQRANTDNWLSQQNFGRALYGQSFSNSMGMLNQVQQYGLEDPELYTPEVMSGYTNFFQQNMNDLLSRYFGG